MHQCRLIGFIGTLTKMVAKLLQVQEEHTRERNWR